MDSIVINSYPPVLNVDGELMSMDNEQCRMITLTEMREHFQDDTLIFTDLTPEHVSNYFFKGKLPVTGKITTLPVVHLWGDK